MIAGLPMGTFRQRNDYWLGRWTARMQQKAADAAPPCGDHVHKYGEFKEGSGRCNCGRASYTAIRLPDGRLQITAELWDPLDSLGAP